MNENRAVGTNGDIYRRKHASQGKKVKKPNLFKFIKINKFCEKKVVFLNFLSLDIIIGAYGSIFIHFQTSNQKSVLKNKWWSSFKKWKIKIPTDLPYLFFYFTPIKPFFLKALV